MHAVVGQDRLAGDLSDKKDGRATAYHGRWLLGQARSPGTRFGVFISQADWILIYMHVDLGGAVVARYVVWSPRLAKGPYGLAGAIWVDAN